LHLRHVPFARRHFPLFLRSVQDQIEQLGGRLIVGEMAPRSNGAAQLDGSKNLAFEALS